MKKGYIMKRNEMEKNIIIPIIACVVLLIMVVVAVYFLYQSENERIVEKVELSSIDTSDNSSDIFTLGTLVDGRRVYFVAFKVNDDGGKQLFKIRFDENLIIYDIPENEKAHCIMIKNGNKQLIETQLYLPSNTIMVEGDSSSDKKSLSINYQ